MDTPFILPTGTVFATLATGIGLTLVLGLTVGGEFTVLLLLLLCC